MHNNIFKLVAGGALLASSWAASAANVSASVDIDWTGLNIFFLPNTVTYTGDGFFTQTNTCCGGGGASQSASDWTTSLSSTDTGPHVSGNASASSTVLHVDVSASSPHPGVASESAQTYRNGNLHIVGNGTLFVTVPVSLQASITNVAPGDYDTNATVYAYLQLFRSAGQGSAYSTGQLSYQLYQDSPSLTLHVEDTLVAGLSVKNGDVIQLQAYDYTQATTGSTVPVPAAVWLLGSALGGLGMVRRRQG